MKQNSVKFWTFFLILIFTPPGSPGIPALLGPEGGCLLPRLAKTPKISQNLAKPKLNLPKLSKPKNET